MHTPDPDMPVRGLEKYISAISNLFDVRASSVELLDLQVTRRAKVSMKRGENVHQLALNYTAGAGAGSDPL